MEQELKVVIDTSIYVAAFKNKSKTSVPVRLIENLYKRKFLAVVSPQILREIIDVCTRKNIRNKYDIVNFFTEFKDSILTISGDYTVYALDEIDLKDNILLAAALEAKADYITSLDRQHILPLKHYYGTQVVEPKILLESLNNKNYKYSQLKSIIFSNS